MTFPYRQSFWMASEPQIASPLMRDINVDVVIVGAGFAGMSTAYYLKKAKPDLDVAILEANYPGFGPSGRNMGVVPPSVKELGEHYDAAISEDIQFMSKYFRDLAGELERRLCEGNIDCDYHVTPTLLVAETEEEAEAMFRVCESLAAKGEKTRRLNAEEASKSLRRSVFGGAVRETFRLLQPYKLARGLRDQLIGMGVSIFEGTRVKQFDGGSSVEIITENGPVARGDKAVIATNCYSALLPGVDEFVMPSHYYAFATEKISNDGLDKAGLGEFDSVLGVGLTSYHYRSYNGHFLFGGAPSGPFDGSTVDIAKDQSEKDFRLLRTQMLQRWPFMENTPLVAAWGGPIDFTESGAPIIDFHPKHENVVLNIGYNGSGVIAANCSGRMVLGLILGDAYVDPDADRARKTLLDQSK